MVEYWNLSLYSTTDNIMDVYAATDTVMLGYFSLFLILVMGTWITYMRLKKGDSPTNSIVLGSFYALLLAIVLYVSQVYYSGILKPGLYVFVPAVILVTTSVVKWYNNR